jgi:hypothetical protein
VRVCSVDQQRGQVEVAGAAALCLDVVEHALDLRLGEAELRADLGRRQARVEAAEAGVEGRVGQGEEEFFLRLG